VWAKPAAGVSTRVSGWYWTRAHRGAAPDPVDPALLQFQNVTRYVSAGVEAEARTGRAALVRVRRRGVRARGDEDEAGSLVGGVVPNAPAITASGGVSTPLLFGYAHLSSELTVIGERPTRADENGDPSVRSPAWFGWNWTLYVPNLRGFDLTAGSAT